MMEDTPDVSLAVMLATHLALRVFERHKPHIFKLSTCTSGELQQLVAEWASPLRAVNPNVIEAAAARWVGERDAIASAPSFATYARGLDRRTAVKATSSEAPTEQLSMETRRRVLDARAREQLAGDWRLVGEVWDILMRAAQDAPDRLNAIRSGDVSLMDFDAAIARVRRTAIPVRVIA